MGDKYQERDIRRGRPGFPYGSDGWLTPDGKISPCKQWEDFAWGDDKPEQEAAQSAE